MHAFSFLPHTRGDVAPIISIWRHFFLKLRYDIWYDITVYDIQSYWYGSKQFLNRTASLARGAVRGSEGHPAAADDLASEKGHLLAKRALFSTITGGQLPPPRYRYGPASVPK